MTSLKSATDSTAQDSRIQTKSESQNRGDFYRNIENHEWNEWSE